ncbi:MAG: 2-phosphosulfolactate phosphatase [Trueperaceae bacterium]|nr:2-phosphosulfolactate phosphatase [Trueperaceae bacterium]MCW5820536.1 2-phosphosulfolactate phosphatase [Trueperaceae bacterium]
MLRTCTVAPMLFDQGASSLSLTPSMRRARAEAGSGRVLVGERQGVPPEGFNHGNSPANLVHASVAGLDVIMVSENAPRWLDQLGGARHVLLGSLYNAEAVARRAAEVATERIDLVCSGFAGEPDLDDTLAAALIAGLVRRQVEGARVRGATRFATALLRAFPEPVDVLWRSLAGLYLRSIGLEQDIGYAARVSASERVPELRSVAPGEHGPLFRFEAA